jgi:hypothetical protein
MPTQPRISFERAIHTTEKHQSDTDTEKYIDNSIV